MIKRAVGIVAVLAVITVIVLAVLRCGEYRSMRARDTTKASEIPAPGKRTGQIPF